MTNENFVNKTFVHSSRHVWMINKKYKSFVSVIDKSFSLIDFQHDFLLRDIFLSHRTKVP
jgi:uncharacterized protein YaaN involved in tellurite resistance